jgi:hypothetical protein
MPIAEINRTLFTFAGGEKFSEEEAARLSLPWLVVAAASQGTGSSDENRIRELLAAFDTDFIPFDRTRKKKGFLDCLHRLRAGGFDLFVFEGTGFAIGIAAILGRILYGRPYIFSSGDAVAPYLTARLPRAKPLFELYESLLYRYCAGFIGWTPYLVGRALTRGAGKGITAAGWAPHASNTEARHAARFDIRNQLGIPQDAIVFGLAGSLNWSSRFQYCYGAELVRAAGRTQSAPYILIVGDGGGRPYLQDLAGSALNKSIFLPGRVDRSEVPNYLAAMDIGSLPQTVDGVGSFRYTTKLPEYRKAGLCLVTTEIPMSYDLDRGDIWRLPGPTPWSEQFLNALAIFMDEVTPEQIGRRSNLAVADDEFDKTAQIRRVTLFIDDVMRTASHCRRRKK